jgi:hypothetical protein
MGTRGRVVIYYKRRMVVLYNHWDSYPSGLGVAIAKAIKEMLESWGIDGIRERFLQARIVTDSYHPHSNAHDLKKIFEMGEFINDDTDDVEWVYTLDLDGMSMSVNRFGYYADDTYKFYGFENIHMIHTYDSE